MAIRDFNVSGRKGLVNASANNLPNLVAISGSNGSGKSSLLELLWQQRNSILEPGSEALYIGPHRTWRGGVLSDITVRSLTQDYGEILQGDALPGFQYGAPGGHNWLGGQNRITTNADDSQAFVKTAIARIANKAQTFVYSRFIANGGEIVRDSVPDLLAPLSELIQTLLPHLRFVKVDSTNQNNVMVLFEPANATSESTQFDIDQLSSGEKAAIALFLPFIEKKVAGLQADAESSITDFVRRTVLIDEPEIHLHPLLQLNVLAYMRELAAANEAQFIFTTHSPTMLDALDTEELFLLSPAGVSPLNQLARLSDSLEKLELARSITGSTHLLTRGKPIVFIEGEPDTSHTASDQRLIKVLIPETRHWAMVPSHGKSQVKQAVKDMRNADINLPGMPVFGLVDSDTGGSTGIDTVIPWSVAMIENLLLDPDAIRQVAQPYNLRQNLSSATLVRNKLVRIANSLKDDEIRRRLLNAMPSQTIKVLPVAGQTNEEAVGAEVLLLIQKLNQIDIVALRAGVEEEVESIIRNNKQLELFHGKKILKAFFAELGFSAAGLGWNAFVTEIARHAATNQRVKDLVGVPINKIRLYFPEELVLILQALPQDEERDRLIVQCQSYRENWVQGSPDHAGRELLRSQLTVYAKQILQSNPEDGHKLLDATVRIGTLS